MQKLSQNQFKEIKKQKKENSSLLFLDNPKIIKDAIKAGHKPLIMITNDPNLIIDGFDEDKVYLTDTKTIEALSDVKTPQGVCIILEYTQHIVKQPKDNFLVLDGLQDPGNVGTLIRTALASGFNDIFLIDSVNETNSKLIRSTAGAMFNLNIMSVKREEFIKKAKEWKLNLHKTDMKGENIFNFHINEIVGVVIGNEGKGVSKEISEICNKIVTIPMKDGIESLNAGVSGAIVMYELNKNKF